MTDGGVSGTTGERIDSPICEIVDTADDPQVRERAREVRYLRGTEVHDR